jgi:hypothetical protein
MIFISWALREKSLIPHFLLPVSSSSVKGLSLSYSQSSVSLPQGKHENIWTS